MKWDEWDNLSSNCAPTVWVSTFSVGSRAALRAERGGSHVGPWLGLLCVFRINHIIGVGWVHVTNHGICFQKKRGGVFPDIFWSPNPPFLAAFQAIRVWPNGWTTECVWPSPTPGCWWVSDSAVPCWRADVLKMGGWGTFMALQSCTKLRHCWCFKSEDIEDLWLILILQTCTWRLNWNRRRCNPARDIFFLFGQNDG